MINKTKSLSKLLVLLLALITAFTLVSCSGGNVGSDKDEPPANEGNSGNDINDLYGDTVNGEGASDNRKIIKTVDEVVTTANYATFVKTLKQSVKDNGGYISSSKFSGGNDGELRYAILVIRIPAENLDEFTGTVGDMATVSYFEEKQLDVTLNYVDIVSRIEVLEAEKVALTSLLEKATTTADILAIRSQLEKVIEELTSLRSQKNVYDNQIAYSTVNMEVYEVEVESEKEDDSFFTKVGTVFMSCLDGIGTFFSSLGIIILGGSPVIILLAIVGLIIYLVVKLIIKRASKNTTTTQYPTQHYYPNDQQNDQNQ